MSLRVDLEGNSSGFQQMLNSAKQNAKAFANEVNADVSHSWGGIGRNLAGAVGGYLGFDALKSHLEGLLQRGNQIVEMSEQFDMTTDSVQKWEKALGRAGVTFTTFTRSLDILRQKREEARGDDKGMRPFAALGISEDIVRGGTPDEALLRMILSSGGDRAELMRVLGPRGARLGAALPYLAGMTPGFSSDDLKTLHGSEQQMKDAKDAFAQASIAAGPGRSMILLSQLLSGDFKGAAGSLGNFASVAMNLFSAGRMWKALFGPRVGGATAPAATEEPEEVATEDPELTLRRKLKEEQVEKSIADEQLRQAKFTREMHQSQLGIMTISERRKTIETDMASIAAEIQAIDNANPALKESLKGQKEALLLEYQRLAIESRENRVTFTPDAMSHVGLFPRVALPGELHDANKTKIDLLTKIKDNTAKSHKDPFAP